MIIIRSSKQIMNFKDLSSKQLQEIINKAELELYAQVRTDVQVIDMILTYVIWEKEFPDKDQCQELRNSIDSLRWFLIALKK